MSYTINNFGGSSYSVRFGLIAASSSTIQTPARQPIDGGLGLLAAAGGVMAVKKLRDRKTRNIKQ